MKLVGIVFVAVFFFLAGCGRDVVRKVYFPVDTGTPPPSGGGTTTPPPPSGGGSDAPTYQETQALLNTHCLRCHASAAFMGSEKGLLASSAKERVWSKSMPPNQDDLPDEERKKILAFFQ